MVKQSVYRDIYTSICVCIVLGWPKKRSIYLFFFNLALSKNPTQLTNFYMSLKNFKNRRKRLKKNEKSKTKTPKGHDLRN